ncbi:hypothetical protein BDZ45DRAFT_679217 [Acephala macrosclerotiorum]|nr:hypothetical protein BDZ45DRAFT_679217 [Acephala macrosclerotiorum]
MAEIHLDCLPPEQSTTLTAASALNDAAVELCVVYEETGDVTKLEEAFQKTEQGIGMALGAGVFPNRMVINQLGILTMRYQRFGNEDDLNVGIESGNAAAKLLRSDHPCRSELFIKLAMLHKIKYDSSKELAALDDCIGCTELALSAPSMDSSYQPEIQSSLSELLFTRYARTGSFDDLNRSVDMAELAVEATYDMHTDTATRKGRLARSLRVQFEQTGQIDILIRSVGIMEEALLVAPDNDPQRAQRLLDLGMCLGRHSEQTGKLDDLDRAIRVISDAEELARPGNGDRPAILIQLGIWLCQRYELTGSLADLNRAVACGNEALSINPRDSLAAHNLGCYLLSRFQRFGERRDIDRSIELIKMAHDSIPPKSPHRVMILSMYGQCLRIRFTLTSEIEDLNSAIEAERKAVAGTPGAHHRLPSRIISLSKTLGVRFERLGNIDDLEESIQIMEEVRGKVPLDHPDQPDLLESYGNKLGKRFERNGNLTDINMAVELSDRAVAGTPAKNCTRNEKLSNLAHWLATRFERTGDIKDINQAIETTDEVLRETPVDNPNLPGIQGNLGDLLARRFERVGALEDLVRAIELAVSAVHSMPRGNIERPQRLNSMSGWYFRRFDRLGSQYDRRDLDRAIEHQESALSELPKNHPNLPIFLNNLGTQLDRRGRVSGSKSDLDQAIQTLNEAADLLPGDHAFQPYVLNNLAVSLSERYQRAEKREMNDIDRSIDVLITAASSMDARHYFRGAVLLNLGNSYRTRYLSAKEPSLDDRDRAINYFIASLHCTDSAPSVRIQAARQAAMLLASLSRWKESAVIFRQAVGLFPLLSPRSLESSDQQHLLRQIAGIASAAAAVALNSELELSESLEFLELGRGVIARLLLEMRMDTSNFPPELASRFLSAMAELDVPNKPAGLALGSDVSMWISDAKRRYSAELELLDVIKMLLVRLDTKSGFLGLPSMDEQKRVIGSDTIIVINSSIFRSDAFLINQNHGIRLVRLGNLKLEEVKRRAEQIRNNQPYLDLAILEWMWDDIVEPILSVLGFSSPRDNEELPRVWWVLVGPLSHLPLHAAGRHSKRSRETTMDRVISSYSMSIKAFIDARMHQERQQSEDSEKVALLVGMSETPLISGLDNLPFAAKEVESLERLCTSLELKPTRIAEPSREELLAQLKLCSIFHFAGHGWLDPLNPSGSGLLLKDGFLTVADLRNHNISQKAPFLGYLSACWTGATDADQLVDEGIHLINACQLAGFRHVIGTLWQVSDMHCAGVAESVYEEIAHSGWKDDSVGSGLHKALVKFRDIWVETQTTTTTERDAKLRHSQISGSPLVKLDWVPYVHFGS